MAVTGRDALLAAMGAVALEPGRCYWVTYECVDIGYGAESGHAELVYRGLVCEDDPSALKLQFSPVGGDPDCYLFPEEITDAWAEGA
jgi:hypothetical protein